jgi:hypothetical protein
METWAAGRNLAARSGQAAVRALSPGIYPEMIREMAIMEREAAIVAYCAKWFVMANHGSQGDEGAS